MNTEKISPSRWFYGLAAVILLAGIIAFVVLILNVVGGVGKSFTYMVVPGSHDIHLTRPGTYIVFYEYQSVVNGKVFSTGETLPALYCTLTGSETGDEIELKPAGVSADYKIGGRAGTAVFEFIVEQPGVYEFAAYYAEDQQGSDVVFAVGPNVTVQIMGTVAGGIAVLFGAFIISVIIAIATFVKRRRHARQQLA